MEKNVRRRVGSCIIELPGICMEFLAFSENPRERKEIRLYGDLVLVSCWGPLGSSLSDYLCVITSPYHTMYKPRKTQNVCAVILLFAMSDVANTFSFLPVLVALAIVNPPFYWLFFSFLTITPGCLPAIVNTALYSSFGSKPLRLRS